jgi:hypothetical protein
VVCPTRSRACEQLSPSHEFDRRSVGHKYGFKQKSPVLSRHNDTGGSRSGSPASIRQVFSAKSSVRASRKNRSAI